MASIAYISDEKMIEFHRLYGHDEINFWRLSTRQFSDFKENDFLFFLVKTPHKEKGIAGFGKLKKIENLSLNQMWNRYGVLNGYESKEDLRLAIDSANKQDVFPGKLNCLYLQQVVYFESHLFLSEFGFELHQNLESFTYIDSKFDVTSQLLVAASSIGLDLWTMSTTSHTGFNFDLEIMIHQLSYHVNVGATHLEKRLAKKFNRDDKLLFIPQHEAILYDQKSICFPLVSSKRKDLLRVFGLIVYCQKKVIAINSQQHIVYTDKKITDEMVEMFDLIEVRLVSVDELEVSE